MPQHNEVDAVHIVKELYVPPLAFTLSTLSLDNRLCGEYKVRAVMSSLFYSERP